MALICHFDITEWVEVLPGMCMSCSERIRRTLTFRLAGIVCFSISPRVRTMFHVQLKMRPLRRSIAIAGLALLSSGVFAQGFQMHYKVTGIKPAPAAPESSFTFHTFTSCGQSGRSGPTESQCLAAYSGSELLGDPDQGFSVNGGIQTWTAPVTATYRIEAFGAQGGSTKNYPGGKGAKTQGDFSLNKGQTLLILVGQMGVGAGWDSTAAGGGGGGTYVVLDGSPLLIAGGGGGATEYGSAGGYPGGSSTEGGATNYPYTRGSAAPGLYGGALGGYGGRNGYGGGGGVASGGAGWFDRGGKGVHSPTYGLHFNAGGFGGDSTETYRAYGGFGGGGAGSYNSGYGGGGGGYSGGGGGDLRNGKAGNGGGAGSFNAGTNPSNSSGVQTGHGQVVISKL